VGILLQKIRYKRYFDLWKLSQIESKHTQVDLKSLVSPSPHTVRIRMRCCIWPMDAQRIRSSFGNSHNWFCAVGVRSVGCVRSLAHLPYLKLTKKKLKGHTYTWLILETLGFWPIMPQNLPIHYAIPNFNGDSCLRLRATLHITIRSKQRPIFPYVKALGSRSHDDSINLA
jgi:hypothetical protein